MRLSLDLLNLNLKPQKAAEPHSPTGIRLLVVTSNDQFYTSLLDIAASSAWDLQRAACVDEALALDQRASPPLVLFDWEESNGDWRDGVDKLSAAPHHPCVLLASRFVDDNLRQEVLRFRGYDVVPKSGAKEELTRAVQFAWSWITRHERLNAAAKQEERH